jgi:hypothetical protein
MLKRHSRRDDGALGPGHARPYRHRRLDVPASATIAAGATQTLTYLFSFPSTAGNTFQGLSQDFTVTYTATQLAGLAR